MPNLVLYKIEASPPAYAIRILCDLIGLELDCKDVDFVNFEHKSPEFMKINPMGTVPTLIDDDFIVSDSNAIMKYLLTKYGGEHNEKLYPSDVRTRAIVDQCLFFNAGVFFNKIKVIALPEVFRGAKKATVQQYQEIDSAYGVVEAYLKNRKFVAADQFTIADLAVGTTAAPFQGIHPIDTEKYPRTAKWFAELNEIPTFKKYASSSTQLLGDLIQVMWEKKKGS